MESGLNAGNVQAGRSQVPELGMRIHGGQLGFTDLNVFDAQLAKEL